VYNCTIDRKIASGFGLKSKLKTRVLAQWPMHCVTSV